jgi:hypothetical protein
VSDYDQVEQLAEDITRLESRHRSAASLAAA